MHRRFKGIAIVVIKRQNAQQRVENAADIDLVMILSLRKTHIRGRKRQEKVVNQVEVICMRLVKNLSLIVSLIFIIFVVVEPIDPTRLRR